MWIINLLLLTLCFRQSYAEMNEKIAQDLDKVLTDIVYKLRTASGATMLDEMKELVAETKILKEERDQIMQKMYDIITSRLDMYRSFEKLWIQMEGGIDYTIRQKVQRCKDSKKTELLVTMSICPIQITPVYGFPHIPPELPANATNVGCESHDVSRHPSGVYRASYLIASSQVKFDVFCFMRQSQWTVFLRRGPVSEIATRSMLNFNRSFLDYENGFGDLNGEYWLGLRYLHAMTELGLTELRIDLEFDQETDEGDKCISLFYHHFYVYTSMADYSLVIHSPEEYRPNSQHHLRKYLKPMTAANNNGFNTYDHGAKRVCAIKHGGGWWYKHPPECYSTLPTGTKITKKQDSRLINWGDYNLNSIQMSITKKKVE